MPHQIHAEDRDFHDVLRAMLCTSPSGTFYFLSRYDSQRGMHADHYEVYRPPPVNESAACASWFGLETSALERLPDLPVAEFPFDAERRAFLAYDAIASRIRGGAG